MSRYAERIDENTTIEYGFDDRPMPGYFYSVEREIPDGVGGQRFEVVEAGDTRRTMIVSENEEHMNRSEIVEKLNEFGVSREEHIEAMALDQPF